MATFTRCEQEAADIIDRRLQDESFLHRLEDSSTVWGVEFPVLIRRTRTIIAMALFNAHLSTQGQNSSEIANAALLILRARTPAEIFAVLPADLGESSAVIEQLRVLSTGLTARSAILWERLAQTARNVLDSSAVYPDEAHVVGLPQAPLRTDDTGGA